MTKNISKLSKGTESIPLQYEFMKVQSYSNDTAGKVRINFSEDQLQLFEGKEILIVEDIVDTGATMVALLELLRQYKPKSIKVASLILKKTSRSNGYVPDYVGFSVPDSFIVGFGLDYNQYFRDLKHICVINNDGKNKFAVNS